MVSCSPCNSVRKNYLKLPATRRFWRRMITKGFVVMKYKVPEYGDPFCITSKVRLTVNGLKILDCVSVGWRRSQSTSTQQSFKLTRPKMPRSIVQPHRWILVGDADRLWQQRQYKSLNAAAAGVWRCFVGTGWLCQTHRRASRTSMLCDRDKD
jgi:hypothetical protein